MRNYDAGISLEESGEPTRNSCAERLMCTVKEEEVDLSGNNCYLTLSGKLARLRGQVHAQTVSLFALQADSSRARVPNASVLNYYRGSGLY